MVRHVITALVLVSLSTVPIINDNSYFLPNPQREVISTVSPLESTTYHRNQKVAEESYFEDFYSTEYKDLENTTTSGWPGTTKLPPDRLYNLGSVALSSNIKSMIKTGDVVCVAAGVDGIFLVNISDPLHPTEISGISTTNALDVKVDGFTLYVADGISGVKIIDITYPHNPQILASLDESYQAHSLDVVGDFVFVATLDDGLRVINVTNPTTPFTEATLDTGATFTGVQTSGNFAFLTDWVGNFDVVNITVPKSPILLSSTGTSGHAFKTVVDGSYAYVSLASDGVEVFNITNPSQPVSVYSFDTPGNATELLKSGQNLYISDGYNGGLRILNVQNPTHPVTENYLRTAGTTTGVALSDNFVFVGDSVQGLVVTSYATPIPIQTVGTEPLNNNVTTLKVLGDLLFASVGSEGLQIVNISNPTTPKVISSIDTTSAQDFDVEGELVYLADGVGGLKVINASNPATPEVVGSLDEGYNVLGIDVVGDIAFLAMNHWSGAYWVVNVSDPLNPKTITTSNAGGGWSQNSVQVVGNYLYSTTGSDYRFYVVNITDPSLPEYYGEGWTSNNQAQNTLLVEGSLAYVAVTGGRVDIFNISEQYSFPVGYLNLTGEPTELSISGDLLFVANSLGGLTVVNVSDSKHPQIVESLTSQGNVSGVAVSGGYIYFGSSSHGLVSAKYLKYNSEFYFTEAVAQSTDVAVPTSGKFDSARLSATVDTPAETSVTFFLSADEGQTFEEVSPGVTHNFTQRGVGLRWKALLATTNKSVTPSIIELSINYSINQLDIITITSPLNITYNTNSVGFTYTLSPADILECNIFLDGVVNTSLMHSGYIISGLSEGRHNLTMVLLLSGGEKTLVSVFFSTDTIIPEVTIISPTSTEYQQSSVTLSYSVNEPSLVTIFLDGTANTTSLQNASVISDLRDGSHNITVKAVDVAGNVGTATVLFTVETIAPTVTIISPISQTYSTDVEFLYYISEQCDVDIFMDGVLNSTNIANGSMLSWLSDGDHNITIIVEDHGGKIGHAEVLFSLDKYIPIVEITSPLAGYYNNTSVTLTYTVSFATSLQIFINGDVNSSLLPSGSILSPNEGENNVTLVARDYNGNVVRETVLFTVDTTKPVVTILSITNATYNHTLELSYEISETTIVIILIDGVANSTSLASGSKLTFLLDGIHNITIVAEDDAGNKGKSTVIFILDRVAPTISISSPTNSTIRNQVVVKYSVSGHKTLTIKLDGVANSTEQPSGSKLPSLKNGNHVLELVATDDAGNTRIERVVFTVYMQEPVANPVYTEGYAGPESKSGDTWFSEGLYFNVFDDNPTNWSIIHRYRQEGSDTFTSFERIQWGVFEVIEVINLRVSYISPPTGESYYSIAYTYEWLMLDTNIEEKHEFQIIVLDDSGFNVTSTSFFLTIRSYDDWNSGLPGLEEVIFFTIGVVGVGFYIRRKNKLPNQ